ncbi:hypothetical protein [Nannocystis exedens]|uniref:hypothetical protein n=1 Tax=Nannocystis exedens TaxID=54 RepID=UPI0014736778|nr:hypothetical protein [Nannocystis exedens]
MRKQAAAVGVWRLSTKDGEGGAFEQGAETALRPVCGGVLDGEGVGDGEVELAVGVEVGGEERALSANTPAPSPRKTDTSRVAEFAVATSSRPSLSKSPSATAVGGDRGVLELPDPRPRRVRPVGGRAEGSLTPRVRRTRAPSLRRERLHYVHSAS